MPTLLLIHGAPGAGKSTVAAELARTRTLALALDIDRLRHALGRWDQDLDAAGRQARRLALAMARRHLADGYDVIVPQFLVRPELADALAEVADGLGARYVEVRLDADAATLASRLRARAANPDRPEHAELRGLVDPDDAAEHRARVEVFVQERPECLTLDARGDVAEVVERVGALLDAPLPGRVILTPVEIEDAEAYVAGEDEETVRWFSGGRSTLEGTRTFLREQAERSERGALKRAFTIRLDGAVAGCIDVDPEVTDGLDEGDVNIAYGVHPWARGRGLAVRAVDLIAGIARERRMGTSLAIRADERNTASLRVAEKAGFTYVRDIESGTDTDEHGRPCRMRVLRRAL